MLTLTRNEQEAEDITQETFLRDLNAKESFSGSLFLPQTNELNRQAGRRAGGQNLPKVHKLRSGALDNPRRVWYNNLTSL